MHAKCLRTNAHMYVSLSWLNEDGEEAVRVRMVQYGQATQGQVQGTVLKARTEINGE